MFAQLPEHQEKIKHSVYYPKAGISVERRDPNQTLKVDPKEMEWVAIEAALQFQQAKANAEASFNEVEKQLVNKIAVAVSMSLPYLPHERMQHALFAKQMFFAGEITFNEYVEKMERLFPNRMDQLSSELREQLNARLK